MSIHSAPLNALVFRGKNLESTHEVSALVVNSEGNLLHSWGDTARRIYPRSSIKSLQAINVILSGAAEKFQVTDQELALASASHNGEPEQVAAVRTWLARIDLAEKDLECGAQKQGEGISALHNNCSGKHAGMLASALAMGVPTLGYSRADHPVQLAVRKVIEDFCSEKVGPDDIAIDGCSIPTYFLHMKNLALGMARFADCASMPAHYQSACYRIFKSVTDYPYFIAGTDRYCTNMTMALEKRALIKTGAEGVMFAALPSLKIGIVVKAHDGGVRASEIVTSWILRELGVLSPAAAENFLPIPIKNWNKIQTGEIKVAGTF